MATDRDYYEILGVSKTATDAELKRAYRKQALEWHPDRNKSKEAESKFKEVNEAYEVLSTAEKRQAYDQYGHQAFAQGGMGNAAGGQNPIGGGFSQGPFSYSYTTSGNMGDMGFDFGGFSDPFEIFEQFFGGRVRRAPRKPVYQLQVDFMDAVNGGMKEVEIDGKRKTIKIPAGVDEGNRIRFDDFDILISVRLDKKFRREGDDIFIDVPITFADAALGTVIDVPTISGELKLNIRSGVQPNTLMRLRGKGVPHVRGSGRGDQYVRLIVQVPTRLNHKQKELLEQLREE